MKTNKQTGLFAGLTLGFLSLDKIGLEIVMEAGDPDSRRCAKASSGLRGWMEWSIGN